MLSKEVTINKSEHDVPLSIVLSLLFIAGIHIDKIFPVLQPFDGYIAIIVAVIIILLIAYWRILDRRSSD